MAKIINLFKKEPDYEKFQADEEALIRDRILNSCTHEKSLEFDRDEDSVTCEKCGKKFTSLEYVAYMCDRQIPSQIVSVYNIRNTIHFLTEKKESLESDIKELKSQKRKLNNENKKCTIKNEST